MSNLVQQIIVYTEGSHEDVVVTASQCSVMALIDTYVEHKAIWDEWKSGPFTKVVRRCKSKQTVADLAEEVPGCLYHHTVYEESDVTVAFATLPLDPQFLHKSIRKCQIANFQRERKGFGTYNISHPLYGPMVDMVVAINPDVEMTTGKTAAQVAHAEMGYQLKHGDWLSKILGYTYSQYAFDRLKDDPDSIKIFDAGNTEIEPNTLTVCMGAI